MGTVYAKTEFFNGTTIQATVDHTNASSIPTLSLDADVNAVKYQGSVVTSVTFTPLDAGLSASIHALEIVGICPNTLKRRIPDHGESSNDYEYNCPQGGGGWNLQVRTKPKVQ